MSIRDSGDDKTKLTSLDPIGRADNIQHRAFAVVIVTIDAFSASLRGNLDVEVESDVGAIGEKPQINLISPSSSSPTCGPRCQCSDREILPLDRKSTRLNSSHL